MEQNRNSGVLAVLGQIEGIRHQYPETLLTSLQVERRCFVPEYLELKELSLQIAGYLRAYPASDYPDMKPAAHYLELLERTCILCRVRCDQKLREATALLHKGEIDAAKEILESTRDLFMNTDIMPRNARFQFNERCSQVEAARTERATESEAMTATRALTVGSHGGSRSSHQGREFLTEEAPTLVQVLEVLEQVEPYLGFGTAIERHARMTRMCNHFSRYWVGVFHDMSPKDTLSQTLRRMSSYAKLVSAVPESSWEHYLRFDPALSEFSCWIFSAAIRLGEGADDVREQMRYWEALSHVIECSRSLLVHLPENESVPHPALSVGKAVFAAQQRGGRVGASAISILKRLQYQLPHPQLVQWQRELHNRVVTPAWGARTAGAVKKLICLPVTLVAKIIAAPMTAIKNTLRRTGLLLTLLARPLLITSPLIVLALLAIFEKEADPTVAPGQGVSAAAEKQAATLNDDLQNATLPQLWSRFRSEPEYLAQVDLAARIYYRLEELAQPQHSAVCSDMQVDVKDALRERTLAWIRQALEAGPPSNDGLVAEFLLTVGKGIEAFAKESYPTRLASVVEPLEAVNEGLQPAVSLLPAVHRWSQDPQPQAAFWNNVAELLHELEGNASLRKYDLSDGCHRLVRRELCAALLSALDEVHGGDSLELPEEGLGEALAIEILDRYMKISPTMTHTTEEPRD